MSTSVTTADSGTKSAETLAGTHQPRWAGAAFVALLAATAAFWTIGLNRNGWANAFYSAAAQAGSQSWKAMLFGSSDAANAITVDKPPASLWPMQLSARIFGVNTWSIQLPQVLLGVASVALLYAIISKRFGTAAGLVAGGALALTPVATLMFRYNNPDALLVFLMIAAVWALLRAVDSGRTRWLLLCGGLLGLGFLTKQLQVLLVVPGLALTYLVAGPPRLLVRVAQLLGGLGAMVVAAGWWVVLVELWPADSRPYIGGSETNSFLDLTLGYNGLGRIFGGDDHSSPSGRPGAGAAPGGGFSGFGNVGLTRLFTGESGGQISWLLPAALVFLVAGLAMSLRSPRTDPRRAQFLAWGGWLVGTGGVFSFMSGLYHDYYTVALAPAVAALVGIGVASLWQRRHKAWPRVVLAAVSALTAAWAWVLLGRTPDFVSWLRWAILCAGVIVAVMIVVGAVLPSPDGRTPGVRRWVAALATVAALAGPFAYDVQTITTSHTGGVPTAGPQIPGIGPGGIKMQSTSAEDEPQDGAPPGIGTREVSADMVLELSANHNRYTWVAATPGSTDAAYYQLATGYPVMALGGFGSSDPAPTLEQFQHYVAEGRIHYYIDETNGDDSKVHRPPGVNESTEVDAIRAWVQQNFTPSALDGVTLYDLTQSAV